MDDETYNAFPRDTIASIGVLTSWCLIWWVFGLLSTQTTPENIGSAGCCVPSDAFFLVYCVRTPAL